MRVELDALPSLLDDLNIAVVTSVTDQLVLTNPTDDVIEILDDDATPFLRIGNGAVEANTSAAGWYLTNNPFGLSELPENLPEQAEWATVAAEPSWGWFDHRLHPPGKTPPPEVVEAGEPALLDRWTVPVRFRGQESVISGSIVYRPVKGSILSELRERPGVDGVDIGTLQGRVPGLFLDNTGDHDVLVLGGEGEPFLRFADGIVEANVHSPAWLAARRAGGGRAPTAVVDAERQPRWRQVSEAPRFGWIEPRAGYAEEEPPANVLVGGVSTTLGEWSIPLRIDGEHVEVTGVTTWQPIATAPSDDAEPAGADRSGLVRGGIIAAAVVVLGGLVVGSRRSRG